MGYYDRVKETTATTGTGTITLGGAFPGGFQTFSSRLGNNQRCYYSLWDPASSNWEVGLGTFLSGTDQLTRDTVYESSNSNALVSFPGPSTIVWLDMPAVAVADLGLTNALVGHWAGV